MSDRHHDPDDRDVDLPDDLRTAFDAVAARHRGEPTVAALRAAEAGALPAPDQDLVAAHLAASRWSQTIVGSVDAAGAEATLDPESEDRLLARIRRDADGAKAVVMRPARFRPQVVIPAIGLAAAAVIAFTVVLQRESPSPVAPAVSPATTQPSAAAPVFHVPIDAPAVKLTSRALVLRSQGTSSAFVDQIAPAIDAYRAGRYHDAAASFAAISAKYPKSVEVAFYRGVSELLDGDAAGAVTSLKTAAALNDPTFADDVAWYLAAAQERGGDVAGARLGLTALCQGTSIYAARACDAVHKLPQ